MKILLVSALVLALVPGASVTFEAEGVRVGGDLVTGSGLSLKESDALPVLVSGSLVESLAGDTLRVALEGREVALGTGLRLARAAEGFRITSHNTAFTLESGGRTITADRAASFKVTEKGFDFGPLGSLEGPAFAARVSLAPARQEVSPERKLQRTGGRTPPMRRVFSGGDPLVGTEASDSHVVRFLGQLSPGGFP